MTIQQWLNQATHLLEERGISSARIDSELILAHALDKDRTYLKTHAEDKLSDPTRTQSTHYLERRIQNEPMAFILGTKEFYGLNFKVDKRALIPRGESEIMVETALDWLGQHTGSKTVAEIGTGSGAITLSLAKTAPHNTYIATELSQEALDLAQENAALLQIKNIDFRLGNLGEPLGDTATIDLILANLPYIPSGLLVSLDPTITYYEPNIALDGGEDGLELYRQCLPQVQQVIAPTGLILFEHEHDHGEAMRNVVREYFPTAAIKTLQDYSGLDRLLYCQL